SLLAVVFDLVGGPVGEAVGANERQRRFLACERDELVTRLRERVEAEASAILDLQVEAGRGPESRHRGRGGRDDECRLVGREVGGGAIQDGARGELRALSLGPVAEVDEE